MPPKLAVDNTASNSLSQEIQRLQQAQKALMRQEAAAIVSLLREVEERAARLAATDAFPLGLRQIASQVNLSAESNGNMFEALAMKTI